MSEFSSGVVTGICIGLMFVLCIAIVVNNSPPQNMFVTFDSLQELSEYERAQKVNTVKAVFQNQDGTYTLWYQRH